MPGFRTAGAGVLGELQAFEAPGRHQDDRQTDDRDDEEGEEDLVCRLIQGVAQIRFGRDAQVGAVAGERVAGVIQCLGKLSRQAARRVVELREQNGIGDTAIDCRPQRLTKLTTEEIGTRHHSATVPIYQRLHPDDQ